MRTVPAALRGSRARTAFGVALAMGAWGACATPAQSADVPLIVVDQFGYLPEQAKVAVLRDPITGFDAATSFEPGSTIELVDADTGLVVTSGAPTPWRGGAVHGGSGDRTWSFDFSSARTAGNYLVRDADSGAASPVFRIGTDVYRDVLVQATRTFYYQRAGIPKATPYADARWSDGASHSGPLQDAQARRYDAPGDASTERDLSGGWYDAGDFNKYTNFTAEYVVALLHAYLANPAAWTDDFGLPESGNGVPDLLDEVRWGLDWLVRMQSRDGGVLSIVDLDYASPPSAARGQSLYGPATTSATLSAAAAYALASTVYTGLGSAYLDGYAADLERRARRAWNWAERNPAVTFYNNVPDTNTRGIGAGQQEVDARKLREKRLSAAIYLDASSGQARFRGEVARRIGDSTLVGGGFVTPFHDPIQRDLLYHAALPTTAPDIASRIRTTYVDALEGDPRHWGSIDDGVDPYRAPLLGYGWGSNRAKATKGLAFAQLSRYSLGRRGASADAAAADYLHYLHGVNPLGIVYLTNMGEHGAERSADTIYHGWFVNGSTLWDSVAESTHGPAPGFMPGGPNPSFTCTGGCPGPLSPPEGQPEQKSYAEFNDDWPIESYKVTEPSNGYQNAYLRLLSRFVR